MATRVNLPKETVELALQVLIDREKRAQTKQSPQIKEVYEANIKDLNTAKNSLTTIK